jgi:hypothetical protein
MRVDNQLNWLIVTVSFVVTDDSLLFENVHQGGEREVMHLCLFSQVIHFFLDFPLRGLCSFVVAPKVSLLTEIRYYFCPDNVGASIAV